MENIIYNVRNVYKELLKEANSLDPWTLFDKLGDLMEYCPGITSPHMVSKSHHIQPRKTFDLHMFRKAGKVPTFKVSKRRGYHAIIFSF